MIKAMMTHLCSVTRASKSVATTAEAEAISPISTPRIAVTGELSHLRERMKPTVAAM